MSSHSKDLKSVQGMWTISFFLSFFISILFCEINCIYAFRNLKAHYYCSFVAFLRLRWSARKLSHFGPITVINETSSILWFSEISILMRNIDCFDNFRYYSRDHLQQLKWRVYENILSSVNCNLCNHKCLLFSCIKSIFSRLRVGGWILHSRENCSPVQ